MDSKELNKIKRAVNKQLLTFKDDVEIVVDTREQLLTHILSYFDKQQFSYTENKINTGDYSFIYQGEDFTDKFAIDRKQNVNELIGNFFETVTEETGKKKASLRFNNELERAKSFQYFSFCIEKGRLADIYTSNYRSRADVNSSIGRFETIKNTIQIDFIEGIGFGEYFIHKVYYWIRSKLIQDEINKCLALYDK